MGYRVRDFDGGIIRAWIRIYLSARLRLRYEPKCVDINTANAIIVVCIDIAYIVTELLLFLPLTQ